MYIEDLRQGAFVSLTLTMSASPINKDNPPDGVLGNQQSTLTAEQQKEGVHSISISLHDATPACLHMSIPRMHIGPQLTVSSRGCID